MNKILGIISIINIYCSEIEAYLHTVRTVCQKQNNWVDNEAIKIKKEMSEKRHKYDKEYFDSIIDKANGIKKILSEEYSEIEPDKVDIKIESFDEGRKMVESIIGKLNAYLKEVDLVDYDQLVPCQVFSRFKKIDITKTEDSKPLKDIVKNVFDCIESLNICLVQTKKCFDKEFNINEFYNHVDKQAQERKENTRKQMYEKYNSEVKKKIIDNKEFDESIFTALNDEAKEGNVDIETGANNYRKKLTIGRVCFNALDNSNYREYIEQNEVLRRYTQVGNMRVPLVLDFKKCGNILINTDEEEYSEKVTNFVNQLIIQFLLSFPANRINFRLIDVDNKMGFSPFKTLTKINSNILYGDIVRDDRELDDAVKDMEKMMHRINDDIISYNNVENIYEYNEKNSASPQNMNLFVLINYPSCMRDDTAKRVSNIVKNGNKTGIFTLIVNNSRIKPTVGYKENDFTSYIDIIRQNSLVINYKDFRLTVDYRRKNTLETLSEFTIAALPSIIRVLQDNAEINKEKYTLRDMYEYTNALEQEDKGISKENASIIDRNKTIEEENNQLTENDKKKDLISLKKRRITPACEELDIPIGRRGGEIQNLILKTTGDGSAHAVVIGGTGSGKSNLLHTIIMNACYKYSPDDLNIYLMDFKGGVEFKYYEVNRLPHIKLTGLTSDVEDGVSILCNLQKELLKRENLLRNNKVEDIVQYNALKERIAPDMPYENLPRLFVIIDEIQELFEQEDYGDSNRFNGGALAQKAIEILRGLVKKGRGLGINILWASQNIPKTHGLREKILSQIGNRISLRLNTPEDALDIGIDPKAVKNLNRPEKGLGVINDIRYGNNSIEFRVAYAETAENRKKYYDAIIKRWPLSSSQEPLFIVGDDNEPSPWIGKTLFTLDIPITERKVYNMQIGQDYVNGKPYDINIVLGNNRSNLLIYGQDGDVTRDMLGYALLSLIINHTTNEMYVKKPAKIYFANGEKISSTNEKSILNSLKNTFTDMVENVSANDKLVDSIKKLYIAYKERSIKTDSSEEAQVYTPLFMVINNMQYYVDVINANPILQLVEKKKIVNEEPIEKKENLSSLEVARLMFASAKEESQKIQPGKEGMPQSINLIDALKELLERGGSQYIHFLISTNNPYFISETKNEMNQIANKIFAKGANVETMSKMSGDYRTSKALTNVRIAQVIVQDEYLKMRPYRYYADREDNVKDYEKVCHKYLKYEGDK